MPPGVTENEANLIQMYYLRGKKPSVIALQQGIDRLSESTVEAVVREVAAQHAAVAHHTAAVHPAHTHLARQQAHSDAPPPPPPPGQHPRTSVRGCLDEN